MEKKEHKIITIEEIKEYLPHRYPFLLIDRVIDYSIKEKEEKYLIALKNVTANEEFFQGHFPKQPIMPGVLIIEAMAQACAILYSISKGIKNSEAPVFFMAIDDCKFRKPVTPGDTLIIKVELITMRDKISKLQGTASVDDKLVCQAKLTAMSGVKT